MFRVHVVCVQVLIWRLKTATTNIQGYLVQILRNLSIDGPKQLGFSIVADRPEQECIMHLTKGNGQS